jgi:hypothetical protein
MIQILRGRLSKVYIILDRITHVTLLAFRSNPRPVDPSKPHTIQIYNRLHLSVETKSMASPTPTAALRHLRLKVAATSNSPSSSYSPSYSSRLSLHPTLHRNPCLVRSCSTSSLQSGPRFPHGLSYRHYPFTRGALVYRLQFIYCLFYYIYFICGLLPS